MWKNYGTLDNLARSSKLHFLRKRSMRIGADPRRNGEQAGIFRAVCGVDGDVQAVD
jgi:hypothetical protein